MEKKAKLVSPVLIPIKLKDQDNPLFSVCHRVNSLILVREDVFNVLSNILGLESKASGSWVFSNKTWKSDFWFSESRGLFEMRIPEADMQQVVVKGYLCAVSTDSVHSLLEAFRNLEELFFNRVSGSWLLVSYAPEAEYENFKMEE